MATPAGFPTIADLGTARIRAVTGFLVPSSAPLAVAKTEAPNARPKVYSEVDTLPAAGAFKDADLSGPYDPAEPSMRFVVRILPPPSPEQVIYASFLKPTLDDQRAIALARLPNAKPDHVFNIAADGSVVANSAVLAYAPIAGGITAPFSLVMNGQSDASAALSADGYRPRPRPDPNSVLSWLNGRALGQFAPGQHDWVKNPLPASVFSAKEQKCLAQGIYFEARGESDAGQAAVAQVILNRVRNPAYPDTVCDVVFQDEKRRNRCQFSFACDGRSEKIAEQHQWASAKRIAREVTEGRIWIEAVGDSTHYHAGYVRPGWGRRMIKVDRIGAHIFYRTRFGGWS